MAGHSTDDHQKKLEEEISKEFSKYDDSDDDERILNLNRYCCSFS
jgi:hypothetical protein